MYHSPRWKFQEWRVAATRSTTVRQLGLRIEADRKEYDDAIVLF
jgi:hypothetical protein